MYAPIPALGALGSGARARLHTDGLGGGKGGKAQESETARERKRHSFRPRVWWKSRRISLPEQKINVLVTSTPHFKPSRTKLHSIIIQSLTVILQFGVGSVQKLHHLCGIFLILAGVSIRVPFQSLLYIDLLYSRPIKLALAQAKQFERV